MFDSCFHLQMSSDVIWQYFAKFGDVTCVEIHPQHEKWFASVFFHETDGASNGVGRHMIGGCTVHASKADAMPKNLLDLNDDCHRGIMDRLELKDLLNVADVCHRLQTAARNVYALKWKFVPLNVSSVKETASYLRTFGPKMKELTLIPTKNLAKTRSEDILELLVKYCGDSLTYLEVHYIAFGNMNALIEKTTSLFTRLRTFVLKECAVYYAKWFTACHELVELTLHDTHVRNILTTRNQTCPKLVTLEISECLDWDLDGLESFLQQNTQLKSFKLPKKCTYFDFIYESIPASIEHLRFSPSETAQLTRFHSLRKLEIHDTHVWELVNRLNCGTLEYLNIDISSDIESQNAVAISELKYIKTLIIRCRICDNANLNTIVKSMKNLTHLQLEFFACDPEAIVDCLLDVVEHAKNLEQLILTVDNIRRMSKINAEMYRKMLQRRSNRKPLRIFIFGLAHQIKRISLSFEMKPSMNIKLFNNYLTRENLRKLHHRGYQIDI